MKLPLFVITGVYGVASAGYFSIAERVVQIPISLLGSAISQVFLSVAADSKGSAELKLLVEKISSKLIHIGLPPAVLFFLTGPELFLYVFGENWRLAGEFAKWMTPWFFMQFISSPLSVVFVATEKIVQSSIWQILLFVANISSLLIGVMINKIIPTIMILSLANVFCYLILFVWIAHITDNSIYAIFRPMIFAALLSFLFVLPVLVVIFLCDSNQYLELAFVVSALIIFARLLQLFLSENFIK
jgi:O-antigen/teichoic acid export membrane protein